MPEGVESLKRARRSCAGTLLVLVAAAIWAQPVLSRAEVGISHDGQGCFVAERFPVIQARLQPPGEVARARVYFRARGTEPWYAVDMKKGAGEVFEGILPRPLESLEAVDYYIEALDSRFAQSRSQEFVAHVVARSDLCPDGATTAATLASGSAPLRVVAPEGAAPVPAGFSGLGLAGLGAAAGATSTGLILGLVGGGAAAVGVGVAVAVGGGKENDGTTGPGPAGTPEPTPTPGPDVSGHWSGSYIEGPSATRCRVTADLTLDLSQSGSNVTGTFQLGILTAASVPEDPCPVQPGDAIPGSASGSLNGTDISLLLQIPVAGNPAAQLYGTVSGDRMGGTSPPDAEGSVVSWDVMRQ